MSKKEGTASRPLGKSKKIHGLLAGGLRGRVLVFARRHGDDDVLVLFVVDFGHSEDELVLVDAELCHFADGQQYGMLVVFRADAIDNVVGLKNVFLAKQFLSLFVLAVGAEDFAGDGLGALF